MKKTCLLLLAVLISVLLFFTPFRQQKELHIKVPFFVVIQQFLKPENWKQWQPDVQKAWQTDSTHVRISKQNSSFKIQTPGLRMNVEAAGFTFKVEKNSIWESNYSFFALPITRNGTTQLTIMQKSSLFSLILQFWGRSSADDLHALKAFLEDTRRYYGFDIRRNMVTDSNIVVEKRNILLKNKAIEIAQTEQHLKAYARQQNLKITQPLIADIRSIGQDSVRLMIGLPVNKQAVSDGEIKFMHQPPHGRMLTGFYTGKYGGRDKLYLAMKTYMADYNLSAPEDAYEKYLDNKIPVSDTSFVRLQINFPIY